jgi:hypothetical protein
MRFIYLLIGFFFISNTLSAQQRIQISGTIKTKEGSLLSNATISLYNQNYKDSVKARSNEKGNFHFTVATNQQYKIVASYIGFDNFVKNYDFSNVSADQVIDDIVMIPGDNMLGNITLESQKVQIKEDTVSYVIDSTMYRKNDNVEAILKNLPGVQVDKDGTVTAQGKQVTKVKVNGKEFFNGDVTTATRELNADMVDKIQIIDDYGDQAAFTGIKDGDPSKTMNIQLKKDKNKGYFGNVSGGIGTDSRYLSSVSVNKFNNSQQISIFGNMNNTNASLFNFGGGGGGGMGGMMSGMARSMGIGRGGAGAGVAFGNTSNNDGISNTKSIGINYRDDWGIKVSVYGSYSFSDKGTSTIKSSDQQSLFQDKTSTYLQQSDNYTLSDNHRFSFNVEYKIDSMNYIKFNPSISYNKTSTDYYSDFTSAIDQIKISDGKMIDYADSKTPNLNGNLLFNHRFKKRGRTFSVNLNGGNNVTTSDENYDNLTFMYPPSGMVFNNRQLQDITQDNNNYNYGGKFSYTEPLSKKRNLEFNYSYNYQYLDNNKKTYAIDTTTGSSRFLDSLSNIYDNAYTTNRFGLNIKTTQKKYNYTVGMSVQPAVINTNSQTTKTSYTNHLVNYYPVIRFAYNFSRSRSLNINYNGNSSQPSNSQLQPVVDRSNPQFITVGNPDLKPEFTNTLSMRYNNFDMISGNVFFGNISASFTQDKIVNSTKLLRGGAQETTYDNANGYFTLFGFYNMSRPIKNRKYVFNLGGNLAYNNNVSFIRDSLDVADRNVGKNWVLGQRFSTDIKIKKWLETNVSVNYSLNSNKYTLQSELNSNTQTWTFSHNSRIFLPKDFIISYDIDKVLYKGFSGNTAANPLIINTTIEKQFLKKKNLSLKLQGFDLLNQNIGVSRSVTGTGFTDTRTNRLGRYFMVSFVYRLNKFFGDMQGGSQMGMPGGGMRGGGEMRPPMF